MASLPPTAHDRRIHELDHNVEQLFDVRKRLGKGAYGIVWKAVDKRQKQTVALKKIFDAFRDETDAQRTYREVIFLRAFRHHPNIIRMLDIYKAGNDLDFYLVFEFMESDLHNVIKKGDVLKDIHKRFVMYQLINAIKYMHSGNVIHRDLKPSNILIDTKCRLKVADFGLARTLSTKRRNYEKYDIENEVMLTDYVATRWYRAPEILVASRKYTKGIDMWSLGCILGEMIRQKPLFQGTSTVNQIEKIVNALPDVTPQDIESMGATFGSSLLSKKIVRDRRNSLEEMLRNCCDDAMSLVKSLLILDPDLRMTAKVAIVHPYVNRFRTASADMELRADVVPPLHDDVRYGVNEYRSSLYNMILMESRNSRNIISNNQTASGDGGGGGGGGGGGSHNAAAAAGRSVSRIRTGDRPTYQSDGNPLGVNTIHRNYTQTWSEHNQHHHNQHNHRRYHHRHQHVHVGSPIEPPTNSQSGELTPTPGLSLSQGSQGPPPTPQTAHLRSANQAPPRSRDNVALRRELAAVVATAPRTSNGNSLWQQATLNNHTQHGGNHTNGHSHGQSHTTHHPHGQKTVAQNSTMWQPPATTILPWPEHPSNSNPHPVEQQQQQHDMGTRLRSRSLRKTTRDNAKLKPKLHPLPESQPSGKYESEPKESSLQQHVERMLAVHTDKKSRKAAKKEEDRLYEQKIDDLEASLKVLQLQQQKKNADLHKTRHQKKEHSDQHSERNERVEPESHPLPTESKPKDSKKIRVVVTPQVAKAKDCPTQSKPQQQQSLPLPAGDGASRECFYTPMDTQRQRSSNSSDITIGTASAKANAAAAAAYCYRSRILYLEAEMAKCKRQLVNYVEDNKELLDQRPLRYHYTQLQSDEEEDEDEGEDGCACPANPEIPLASLNTQQAKSPQSDSGVEIEQSSLGVSDSGGAGAVASAGAGAGGDPSSSQTNYKSFRMQQHKQKQLQVKEFLTRDDANAYELRTYKTNVYIDFADHQRQHQLDRQHQQRDKLEMGSLETHSRTHLQKQLHQQRPPNQYSKDLTYECQQIVTLRAANPVQAYDMTTGSRSCQSFHHQHQQQQQQQQHLLRPEDIHEAQLF